MVKPTSQRSTCGWAEVQVAGGTLLIENMPDVYGHGRNAQRITLYAPTGETVVESYLTPIGPFGGFDVRHSDTGTCLCSVAGRVGGVADTGVEL